MSYLSLAPDTKHMSQSCDTRQTFFFVCLFNVFVLLFSFENNLCLTPNVIQKKHTFKTTPDNLRFCAKKQKKIGKKMGRRTTFYLLFVLLFVKHVMPMCVCVCVESIKPTSNLGGFLALNPRFLFGKQEKQSKTKGHTKYDQATHFPKKKQSEKTGDFTENSTHCIQTHAGVHAQGTHNIRKHAK